MLRISLGLLLAITSMSVGCGYGSHNYMNGNGTPQITTLSPSTTLAGGAAFSLAIKGTGFGTDSLVYWGTTTLTTTYDSTTQVTANITTAEIMNAGTVPVYIHSGGMNSNAMSFTITP